MHKWIINNDFDTASKTAAEFLAERITESVNKKGVCHVILPGGNTPVKCLKILSEMDLPWGKIHWYPGDERVLPAGSLERNDDLLERELWSKIPAGIFHKIPVEQGAEKAAEIFRNEINDVTIDIAFLGMGEDGHTASLFLGNDALHDDRSVIPVYNSPKAPDERVSFSIKKLGEAQCRMVLTCGESKSGIIDKVKQGEVLPVNNIGDIYWFIDEAAAGNKV